MMADRFQIMGNWGSTLHPSPEGVVPTVKYVTPVDAIVDTHGDVRHPVLWVRTSYIHEVLGLLNQRPTDPQKAEVFRG